MVRLVYAPDWFFGKDILIDVVSIIVLALLAFFSFRYYRLQKQKNYKTLSTSFFLLSLSYLIKILTNFSLYFHVLEEMDLGTLAITHQTLEIAHVLSITGLFLYRLLTLIGLFMLYTLYDRPNKGDAFLLFYLALLSAYISMMAYGFFHLTSLMFLVLITVNYWNNFKKTKTSSSRLLCYSFATITMSHLIFVLVGLRSLFYVAAEFIQLLGFVMLLSSFIMVLSHGKKKQA